MLTRRLSPNECELHSRVESVHLHGKHLKLSVRPLSFTRSTLLSERRLKHIGPESPKAYSVPGKERRAADN